MQGILQEDGEEGFDVRVPRGSPVFDRQEAEEPLPVLPLPEMSADGHETRGRSRGATTQQGKRRHGHGRQSKYSIVFLLYSFG